MYRKILFLGQRTKVIPGVKGRQFRTKKKLPRGEFSAFLPLAWQRPRVGYVPTDCRTVAPAGSVVVFPLVYLVKKRKLKAVNVLNASVRGFFNLEVFE